MACNDIFLKTKLKYILNLNDFWKAILIECIDCNLHIISKNNWFIHSNYRYLVNGKTFFIIIFL